jgi:excisionase family DNA binding protein
MDNLKEQKFWTVAQVAKHFTVSNTTVYRWINSNLIEAIRLNGLCRIPSKEIDRIAQGGINEKEANVKLPVPKVKKNICNLRGRRPWEK